MVVYMVGRDYEGLCDRVFSSKEKAQAFLDSLVKEDGEQSRKELHIEEKEVE